jgi:hypothetical protein
MERGKLLFVWSMVIEVHKEGGEFEPALDCTSLIIINYFVVFRLGITLLLVPSIERTKDMWLCNSIFWLYVKTVKFRKSEHSV